MTTEQISPCGQGYFAAVASDYDRLQPILAGPGYEAGLAMMVDLVPFEAAEPFTFVDLGCGTGELARRILQRYRGARAICIDSEAAMLSIARTKLAGYASRAEVRRADVAACELPPCDLVLSSMVFHHVPPADLVSVFTRIACALRPGGTLLLLDQMAAGPIWGQRIGSQRRRLHDRHADGWVSVGRADLHEVSARWTLKRRTKEQGLDIEHRHSAEALLAAMSSAGFAETGLVWRMFAMTVLMACLG